jgi:hypothetical protein
MLAPTQFSFISLDIIDELSGLTSAAPFANIPTVSSPDILTDSCSSSSNDQCTSSFIQKYNAIFRAANHSNGGGGGKERDKSQDR